MLNINPYNFHEPTIQRSEFHGIYEIKYKIVEIKKNFKRKIKLEIKVENRIFFYV